MEADRAQQITIGSTVRFKLCDSDVIHSADVVDIQTVQSVSLYSPSYTIYVCKDLSRGWLHRLTAKDLL